MNKLFVFLVSLLISFNSYGEWRFHSSSLQGDSFHIHIDTIIKDERYVYFWYLKSYLMPNKFGDFSSKVNVQGDCSNNRLKYLSYVWYKEPMGKGPGQRSEEESEWEYPTSESVGIDLLHYACNS
tara:strand:+ start:241 stop:615 length:375 start_codon:yes stop_codon:yes gene_type:complete